MKKIIRLTESDLTRIIKRTIKEGLSDRKSFNLDKPLITYREIVNSILSEISIDVASELNVDEYDRHHDEVPNYLRPYVKEVEDYVTSDDMLMKLWDSINDVILDTPINDKIVDDILSN